MTAQPRTTAHATAHAHSDSGPRNRAQPRTPYREGSASCAVMRSGVATSPRPTAHAVSDRTDSHPTADPDELFGADEPAGPT